MKTSFGVLQARCTGAGIEQSYQNTHRIVLCKKAILSLYMKGVNLFMYIRSTVFLKDDTLFFLPPETHHSGFSTESLDMRQSHKFDNSGFRSRRNDAETNCFTNPYYSRAEIRRQSQHMQCTHLDKGAGWPPSSQLHNSFTLMYWGCSHPTTHTKIYFS
jgi:hypothetical protein